MEFFTDDAVYHNIPLTAAKGKAEIRKTIDGFMPGDHERSSSKYSPPCRPARQCFNERVDSFIVNGRPVVVPVAGRVRDQRR